MHDETKTIRFDETNLCPDAPGIRFNPSIIETQGGYLFTYRHSWIGSEIYVAWLDEKFRPTGRWRHVDLPKHAATRGKEDARLFRVGGKLFMVFCGFTGRATHQLFVRLDESTMDIERWYWPQLVNSNFKEKNFVPFDYNGIPHFVYTVAPHEILRIPECAEGLDPIAERIHKTDYPFPWSGGMLRGGAAPVLHDGEWYHFFHGSTGEPGSRTYNMGVYTFSRRPPFEVLRASTEPIDTADPSTKPEHVRNNVIFPGGAVRHGNGWAIAHGIHDTWSEIRFYSDELIEGILDAV